MDQQASSRWLETLKREQNAKAKWQEKYLSAEQKQREIEEQEEAARELEAMKGKQRKARLSERDAMELRLAALDDAPDPAANAPAPLPDYEIARQAVAAQVAATRQRSHRYTGDLSTDSMLKDIGPALWISVNPAYAPSTFMSSQHRAHCFNKAKGWGEKVDKKHHLVQNEFMAHAEKTLQLGEKPFLSGGMKAK